jgi:hypothetical protein
LYHSYHYLRNNFCSAAHFLHVPSTPELRLCDADFKFFREEFSAFFRGAALAAGLACTPRGVQPVTDGTDTHIAASARHSGSSQPSPKSQSRFSPSGAVFAHVECDDIVPGSLVGSIDADALRPAHTCSVSGVVAMGVSD